MSGVDLPDRSLSFLGLGQAGVAIGGPGGTIYVDPYLTYNDGSGGRLERLFPPPLQPQAIRDASAVLVTHEHIDHFDPQTLGPLSRSSPESVFVAPHSCDLAGAGIPEWRTVRPVAFEPLRIGSATVTPLPSAHTGLDKRARGYPYLGYLIEWNGVTLYHSGDTVIYDQDAASGTPGLLATLGRWTIDVIFVPINGRDYFRSAQGLVGNIDAREAATLAELLDVRLIVPTHYDLVKANSVNPAHFVDILREVNPARPHHLLRPGERFMFALPPGP
jgi:L-ascorbate 6-phosphate lactonase